ncbi:metal regulatory transcription factor 1 [Trichonephila clavata]|uniref:Metal regulatory transcription factor 1 n=1 Tax=Trichonephila clavata TaxID=2740835 RepID=A0A8X6KZQ1_TRICU|nr:metal regulatory transcription factor 1 [Trichonephila clavata]
MDIDDSDDSIFNKSGYIDFGQLVDSPEDSSLYSNHNLQTEDVYNCSAFESSQNMIENSSDQDNSGYIQHTITEDEIRMHIRHNDMPENLSHAILTVESRNQKTNEKEYKKFHCDYEGCERTYSTAGNLKTHQKRHKGDILMCETKPGFIKFSAGDEVRRKNLFLLDKVLPEDGSR